MFLFFPLFLLSYFISPKKYKNIVLLSGSLGFYLWGEPIFCFIAIASAILDYVLCKKIHGAGIRNQKAKRYLIIGICANIGLLLYFKYTQFFLQTISSLTSHKFDTLTILLPIGISFIVFEKITYLVDVYRGESKPAKNMMHYLTYVFLFPKLLAGPIIKYHEIANQLNERKTSSDDFFEGFKRFIRGLAKKVFIADACGFITNQVFALPANDLSFGYAWIGLACFTLQIYFDFSAYSDMALGLARMLGFKLRENFNMPYISESFTEFWRRWHISLSTWIRDYLYIPLGGSRTKPSRVYVNLWICFLLSGLWHGANWTFVLWGAYHGLFLVLDKWVWLKMHVHLPKIMRLGITLFLIMLGWVIFRASDFTQMLVFFKALFNPFLNTNAYIDLTTDIYAVLLIGIFISLFPTTSYYKNLSSHYLRWTWRISFEGVFFGLLGLLSLCKVLAASYTPFLYFKF